MDDKKTKALELAIASVEKEYGRGAIMRLKEGEKIGPDVASSALGTGLAASTCSNGSVPVQPVSQIRRDHVWASTP